MRTPPFSLYLHLHCCSGCTGRRGLHTRRSTRSPFPLRSRCKIGHTSSGPYRNRNALPRAAFALLRMILAP
ncbi:hypothetical protein HMPREF3293_03129 [Christensenella minuta]|uniref:Uncharacterized protein n=1 Tax=Christensenella minuta TaxID=626937 RepID=A0A136Q064_9FIRM|nr:hypothetical protein HMPREF3293_03129 [Christensenella minuta]